MKKLSLSVLFLLLSLNVFAYHNLPLMKEGKMSTFSIDYKLYEDTDKGGILILSDDTNENRQVRFFTDNVTDGYNCLVQCEKILTDLYNRVVDTMGVDYFNELNSYPIFTFAYAIRHYMGLAKEDDTYFNYIDLRTQSENEYIVWDSIFSDYFNSELDLYDIGYEHTWYKDVYLRLPSDDGRPVVSVLELGDTDRYSSFWNVFQEHHPEIQIIRKVFSMANYQEELNLCSYYNTLPDIIYMWPAGVSNFIHEQHLTKDLTSFVEEYDLEDNFPPCVLNPKTQSGNYIAELPLDMMVTNLLYVNKKVLKECGLKPAKTYKDLKKQLSKVRRKGYNLIGMGNDQPWVLQSTLFSMICGRYMGEDWANNIISGKDSFRGEGFKKALEMLKTMVKDKVISQDSFYTSYQDMPYLFSTDNYAYMIDGDWRTGAFVTDKDTGYCLLTQRQQEEDIEIIPFPSLPNEEYEESSSGVIGQGYGISCFVEEGSEEEKACYTVLNDLYGKPAMAYRCNLGHFPLISEDILKDMEPIFTKRADFYSDIKTLTPVLDSIFPQSVSNLANTLLQKLCLDQVTVEEVSNALNQALLEEQSSR